MKNICKILSILFFLHLAFSCGSGRQSQHEKDVNISDTLKVVTIYGPTSYFLYRGEQLGFDYENVRRFAEDENMILDLKIVNTVTQLIDELKNGNAHLGAYPIPYIAEYNSEILHCGPKEISWQVIVQKNSENKIKDVIELVGKDVYVEENSKFHFRLINLNEEIGGGINIIPIGGDTISSEDLLRMVNNCNIKYAVVDSDLAALYKSDYPNLDTSLKISLEQTSSWAVAPQFFSLAAQIDSWEKSAHNSPVLKEIFKRYYDSGDTVAPADHLIYFKGKNFKNGDAVSPYDSYFKKYAPISGFDWQLLAAIAFCESRFQTTAQSRFGASGLMQIMPSSAIAYGVNPAQLTEPDQNILAGARILASLDKSLQSKVEDPQERIKFILASYNSGLGHIYDAIALAEKYGMNPKKWTGNVSVATMMKSRPEYYNDPVVKHGFFRGRETTEFVDRVLSTYNLINPK